MNTKKTISASAIGKTAFCPNARYLSKKHPPNKASEKRMMEGVKKHNHLTKTEKKSGSSLLLWLIFSVAILLTMLMLKY